MNHGEKEAKRTTVDIVIPTFRPGEKFERLLYGLAGQVVRPDHVFVVNTDKRYWNERWEKQFPYINVRHIEKGEFDHGGTRNAVAKFSSADILIFMTQDAVADDGHTIENLIRPIVEKRAEISYGRQIPFDDADIIEKFTRNFNYPPESRIKSKKDMQELGIKTFFSANTCCAYLRSVFDELGGFPNPAVLNEDNIFAGKAIEAGYRLSYTAEAKVIHSHKFTGMDQFHRYFDIGVSHAMYPDIFFGHSSKKEGASLVKQTIRYVCRKGKPYLIFKVVWLNGWKLLGYCLGRGYEKLSEKMIYKCTMNPIFWDRFLRETDSQEN